ncbi:MAG TPA: hypothetical protein VES67_15025 [Vicinamibacterales bacterium]|nr:hypothetical protein [Vicinamibacterales bacterium]
MDKFLHMWEAVALVRGFLDSCHRGKLLSPPRFMLKLGEHGLVLTAGAVLGRCSGLRVYHTRTPQGDEPSQLTVVFNDDDGSIRGIFVGDELGEWRTGALGGIAVSVMSPPEARVLGILGCGRQAATQLAGALAVRTFEHALVYCRDHDRRKRFASKMSMTTDVDVRVADTAKEVVERADVLVCATSSLEPILDEAWLKSDVHINHIGPKLTSGSELPRAVHASAALLVSDAPEEVARLGSELVSHGMAHRSLAEILRDRPSSRLTGRSVYVSLGLAGTEVALAREVFDRAAQEVPS